MGPRSVEENEVQHSDLILKISLPFSLSGGVLLLGSEFRIIVYVPARNWSPKTLLLPNQGPRP